MCYDLIHPLIYIYIYIYGERERERKRERENRIEYISENGSDRSRAVESHLKRAMGL